LKKATKPKKRTASQAEYGFSPGVRGKFARRFAQGSKVIVLQPDVAKVFPDAASVNDSLRALAGIIHRYHKPLKTK